MSEPFLITGLPRSRTAWLSVLFTAGRSMCFHEPVGFVDSMDDLRRLWSCDHYRYVGMSDSTLALHLPWIMAAVQPRVLIVERDIDDVEASLERLGEPATNLCELILDALRPWASHRQVMRVPFESLDDVSVMAQAWRHLTPSEPFNVERYERLSRLNIQADLPTMKRIAKSRGEAVAQFLRPVIDRLVLKEGA